VDTALMGRVEEALKAQNISPDGLYLDGSSLKIRFKDADTQIKARDAIQHALGDSYIIALNLLPASPQWLADLKAYPMFLGLDLRGGVHFLLQVDMQAAIDKTMERYAGDIRRELKNKQVRYGTIKRNGNVLEVQLRDADTLKAAQAVVSRTLPTLVLNSDDAAYKLTATLKPEEVIKIQGDAVKQNISTLHNRVTSWDF
jgi:preprotein translocase subunit SecD